MNKFAIFLFISFALSLYSCVEEIEGCTDSQANTYNSEATISNNEMCLYYGEVVFWWTPEQAYSEGLEASESVDFYLLRDNEWEYMLSQSSYFVYPQYQTQDIPVDCDSWSSSGLDLQFITVAGSQWSWNSRVYIDSGSEYIQYRVERGGQQNVGGDGELIWTGFVNIIAGSCKLVHL